MGKSKILVVGATGGLGKHIAKASVKEGHPTFILVRKPSSSAQDAAKRALLAEFESLGVTTLYGDLNDHASLVTALKQVDVVISSVGGAAVLDGQLKLIEAIKEVGHIKRFLPSEFGCDSERRSPQPALDIVFAPKRAIRKAVREAGIPYTFVLNGAFAGFLLAPLGQLDILLSGNRKPPREKITILGSGEGKIVTTAEDDIGTLTVKAADDPRAVNKLLVIRPPPNVLSFNSVVALWEKKLGHSLEKTFVPESEVQKQIDGSSPPANYIQALLLEVTTGSEIYPLSPTRHVAADELYPDYKYITVDEYLDNFVEK